MLIRRSKTKKRVYKLLLCDGYGSYIVYEFVKFCEQNHIIVILLISHTSNSLQPLDSMSSNNGISRMPANLDVGGLLRWISYKHSQRYDAGRSRDLLSSLASGSPG
jgi:hypothetical protein